MALVTKNFTLNVTPGAMPPTIHVSEYDVGRTYTITLLDANGSAFEIPTGTTAAVEGTLNGTYGFTTSATISGNQISFALTESMTAYAGNAWCKIKLTLNSEPIQTCAFILAVDRAGVEADTVIGAPDFQEQVSEGVAQFIDSYGGVLPPGGQAGQVLMFDGERTVWATLEESRWMAAWDKIDHEDLPDYVKSAAMAVARRVSAVMVDDSIVFLVGSDAHQSSSSLVVSGNLHAGMAMKALAYILHLDFAAYLGDYTEGSGTTTIDQGFQHITDINNDIAEAFRGLPQFRTVGNHDPCGYSYNQNGEAISQADLYQLIGKFNAYTGATMGSTTGGYCYRDFADRGVRVICLNTSDMEITEQGGAEAVSDAQKKWFADTLISTPQDYGIIILSHHPLDWGNIVPVSGILRAYAEEHASMTIAGTAYSFTDKNKSAWIVTFHGHTHCFKVDNLHWNNAGTGEPYDLMRIAIPNMCFYRNNEYGRNAGAEYIGIEFGDEDTYNKTANSSEDTAFCVVVVNPSTERAHAICYGAGIDRDVYFGGEKILVTGVSLSPASGSCSVGDVVRLTATVQPSNASNKTVLWSTSNSAVATVANGTVTAVAAGTATITATTQDGGYTATYMLTVQNAERGNMVSVFGYTDGKRLSTGSGELKDAAAYTTIGFIDLLEYADGDQIVIRVKGIDFTTPSGGYRDSAYVLFNASKTLAYSDYTKTAGDHAHGSINVNIAHTYGTNGSVFTITGLSGAHTAGIYYVRFCGYGSGANLDIRVNEDFD